MRRITPSLLQRNPPPLNREADKDERGRVLVVGGTVRVPGAVILAAIAALRAGAGKLQIGVPASISLYVGTAIPEALVIPLKERRGSIGVAAVREVAEYAQQADAIALGPGMSEDDSGSFVCDVLKRTGSPVVLDAGALAACKAAGDLQLRAVLTPHAGEMAALLECEREKIEADPAAFAVKAAQRFNAVVALKGPATYIADPGGRLLVNEQGHVGLATSGSGDALAGIVAGLLARGVPPMMAAAWAVYLHASAGRVLGRRVGIGFLAHELLAEIPPLMKRLSAKN